MDVPEIETLIMEEHSEQGPYGAKSMGNTPILPTAPAIANAVYDAIGVRINDLPITPDKVLSALKKKLSTERPEGS